MVKIDGSRIRALREEKGLTQLYLATAVAVTTDTISRWENRRYPTIKKENAEKLAEALEVGLDEILDAGEKSTPAPAVVEVESDGDRQEDTPPVSAPVTIKWIAAPVALCLFLIAGWFFWSAATMEITAVRIMPEHSVPGQPFPVIIRVLGGGEGNVPFIIRENIREKAVVASLQPKATVAAVDGGSQIKWINKLSSPADLAYTLTSSAMEVGGSVNLQGTITVRKFGGSDQQIGGRQTVQLAPFHWADSNRDNRIDDQEILAVYADYAEIDGIELGLSSIEDIWFGSSYKWDQERNIFVITP